MESWSVPRICEFMWHLWRLRDVSGTLTFLSLSPHGFPNAPRSLAFHLCIELVFWMQRTQICMQHEC